MYILAANARWADAEEFRPLLDEVLSHITDEKPITARQCIQTLPEIAAFQPRLAPRIRQALEHLDLTGYRGSMAAADFKGRGGRAGKTSLKGRVCRQRAANCSVREDETVERIPLDDCAGPSKNFP